MIAPGRAVCFASFNMPESGRLKSAFLGLRLEPREREEVDRLASAMKLPLSDVARRALAAGLARLRVRGISADVDVRALPRLVEASGAGGAEAVATGNQGERT